MRKNLNLLVLGVTVLLCVQKASAAANTQATGSIAVTTSGTAVATTKKKKKERKRNAALTDEEKLEEILDAVSLSSPAQPIIKQWLPTRRSIWLRYHGTILQNTLWPSLRLSIFTAAICVFISKADELPGFGTEFSAKFISSLERMDKLWHMHLSILSFFSAFFLNNAKGYFDSALSASRSIQGRLNDLNLLATSHACRDASTGCMTPEAQEIVTELSRYMRVVSILFYSSVSRRYAPLLTDNGLFGMHRRGLITEEERKILAGLPPKTRYTAAFTWIVSTFTRGCEDGKSCCFRMPTNCHYLFIAKMGELRGACGTIGDLLDARCPLSYVHFIQILVDSFLVMTPFAAVADMGWFSIGASFLLSMFFCGLLDLSKMLYDPLDNDDFGSEADNIQVDTLIQESSSGSKRFLTTGHQLPFGARQQP